MLSSSHLCRELLFVAYGHCCAMALLCKQGMSCDLRRGRFDTTLFTSNICNETSQVWRGQLLLGTVRLQLSKTGRFGHSKHFDSSLIGSQVAASSYLHNLVKWSC